MCTIIHHEACRQERIYTIIQMVVHIVVGPELPSLLTSYRKGGVEQCQGTISSGSRGGSHSQPYDVSSDLHKPWRVLSLMGQIYYSKNRACNGKPGPQL